MNPATSLPLEEVRAKVSSRSNPARFLYAAVSAVLFVLMLVGFQQFYLHGQAYPGHPFPPPIKGLLIAHGTAMTGWMVLFLVQPLLIVSGNRRMHMSLGMIGAVLAAGIVVLGILTPIATTRVEPDMVLWGFNRKQFMAIPIISILTFGTFVAIGVWNRRRPEIHRPMMLLATLSVIAAATDRITGLPDIYAPTIWGRLFGPFFVALVIGALFLAVKTALTRSFDRRFAGGFGMLIVVWVFIMKIAPTTAWDRVASWLTQ
jgi:hypothetical protein